MMLMEVLVEVVVAVLVTVTVEVLVEVGVGHVPVGGTEGGVVIHTVREWGSLDKQEYIGW